jgi:hypothetical protein
MISVPRGSSDPATITCPPTIDTHYVSLGRPNISRECGPGLARRPTLKNMVARSTRDPGGEGKGARRIARQVPGY